MKYVDESLIEEAKQKVPILQYIEDTTGITAKRIGGSKFINPCPFCGRKDHFSINEKENYFYSFGCDAKGTIINFMELYEGLTTKEAMQKLFELADMTDLIDNNNQPQWRGATKQMTTKIKTNFTELMEQLHRNVSETDYFISRGLSQDLVNKYKLGYSANGFNEAIQYSGMLNEQQSDILKSFKYFLPVWDHEGECSYFITRVDDQSVQANPKINKTHNLKGYPVQLFNERYLVSSEVDTIFIVEGIFDALSIEELGYPAIALNSVSNASKLAKLIQEHEATVKNKVFILVPDNDMAGEKLVKTLKDKASEINFRLQVNKLPFLVKDVNEFLVQDRDGLKEFLDTAVLQEKKEWDRQFVDYYLNEFIQEVTENMVAPIPTGFEELDERLNGGLVSGLYVIGGSSSLGKTAFIHQVADYVSSQETPVFYFSLEMSKKELVGRSLSRQSFQNSPKKAYSSTQILQNKIPREELVKTMEQFRSTARNLSIIESTFNSDVLSIRKAVSEYKTKCSTFVVIVDYLQILQPPKGKNLSDKQLVDYNVTQLKKMSRDFDIPVLVISSFNRANYNHTVSFESFKESGGIEYSADVVMGLQLKGIEKQIKNGEVKRELVNQTKAKEVRELELVILKQRNGVAYAKMEFMYQAKYNYFQGKK